MIRVPSTIALFLLATVFGIAQSNDTPALLVKAEAGTIVWVDNLRYGTVSDSGELTIQNLKPGAHKLRARLLGKRELTQSINIKAAAPTMVQLTFKLPASAAEQSFQNAEALREKGKHKDAIAEYRSALKRNKGSHAQARIGLARSLMATSEYEDAITEARRAVREAGANSTLAAEATTVIANTYRAQGLYDEAFENYRKALSLARNISPEAHTGLALTWQEENKSDEAIKHLRLAVAQANDTEPIIYYLLGNLLDREGQIKEAIEVYEKYLLLDPNSKFAVTTRSMLKQLKREAR
ncbi:MAG TPA: tetratricopeptide repeat protein [Blastocatellia bacterium]|nr:tetratricopeptide repeat protein [Blastocatellia bacterium]